MRQTRDKAPSIVVIYSHSFPPDPATDLKNFLRKQTEFEAAYRCTGEPLVLREALLHAKIAQQLTPVWLVTALGNILMWGRTDQAGERFKERMRHVQRYRCVRDLRQKGHTKDRALDLAVARLEAADAAAARRTIEDSYDRVRRNLEQKKRESEYFYLVARSDPTVVPVSVTQRSGGVAINGVTIRQAGGRDC